MSRSSFVISLIILFVCADHSSAESNFITVNVMKSVTVDLPRNWFVMSDNKRITLDAWKDSVLEARKLSDADNNFPFAANYTNDFGNPVGTLAIRVYPKLKLTEAEASSGDAAFLKELDAGIRKNYTTGYEAGGGKLVAWLGTKKKSINGSTYFVSECRGLPPKTDGNLSKYIFRIRLVRHLNAEKSFVIIVSYREDEQFFLKPICDRIIGSILVEPQKIIDPETYIQKAGAQAIKTGPDGNTQYYSYTERASDERIKALSRSIAELSKDKAVVQAFEVLRSAIKATVSKKGRTCN